MKSIYLSDDQRRSLGIKVIHSAARGMSASAARGMSAPTPNLRVELRQFRLIVRSVSDESRNWATLHFQDYSHLDGHVTSAVSLESLRVQESPQTIGEVTEGAGETG